MNKRNDWTFIASLAAYSFLFWGQTPGLNFLIMNCILVVGFILRDKSVFRNREWLIAAASALITSSCVAWYGNSLSVFANIAAIMATAAFSLHRGNSIVVAGLLAFLNMATSIAYIIIEIAERAGRFGGDRGAPKTKLKKAILLGVVAIVGIIFFCLYRGSSVMFESVTDKINLDFISIPWCVFVIGGSILLFGFYRQQKFEWLSSWDRNLPMKLAPKERTSAFDRMMSLESEHFTGIALFGMLNVLLLVVNGLDIAFLTGGEQFLPNDVTYSEYVHQGTNALIFSIIFATALILGWFRNYQEKGKSYSKLRLLALLWILQNMFMIATTIYRNHSYVFVFGLTYQRIGVDVFLLLSLIGLALVFWKIIKQRSNASVAKYFGWACFGVFVCSTPINWDQAIFNYNSQLNRRLDMDYLNSLSWTILPDQHKFRKSGYILTDQEYRDLHNNTFAFLSSQRQKVESGKWPSVNISLSGPEKEILEMKNLCQDGTIGQYWGDLGTIYYFPCYSGIKELILPANQIISIGEVAKYEHLEKLNLSGNYELQSIAGIQHCKNLREIDLRSTQVTSYTPLTLMPQLRVLYVSYIDAETERNLRNANPNLTIQY